VIAGDDHPVVHREAAHRRADRDDGPDRLVAEDATLFDGGHVPLEDVQVGPADGGRVDLDHDVGRVDGLRIGDGFPGLLAGTVIDECLHRLLLATGAAWCDSGHIR
jgi:hypothetical protein